MAILLTLTKETADGKQPIIFIFCLHYVTMTANCMYSNDVYGTVQVYTSGIAFMHITHSIHITDKIVTWWCSGSASES